MAAVTVVEAAVCTAAEVDSMVAAVTEVTGNWNPDRSDPVAGGLSCRPFFYLGESVRKGASVEPVPIGSWQREAKLQARSHCDTMRPVRLLDFGGMSRARTAAARVESNLLLSSRPAIMALALLPLAKE